MTFKIFFDIIFFVTEKGSFFAACSYHCEKNANMLTAKIKIANLKTNFAWFVMTKKRIVKLRHANAVRFFKELK